MKLLHEMERRPAFGRQYNNDPDGPIRLWIARTQSLVDRVSIKRSIEFGAALSTSSQCWVPAMAALQIAVRSAIEDLKLELELFQNDQIGTIYDVGQEYRFAKDLLAIVENADSEIFVVDPYFAPSAFTLVFSEVEVVSATVRILMGKGADGVREVSRRYTAETGVSVDVRTSKSIHDRLLFIDKSECWLIGGSVKDGGKKPTYIMPVQPALVAKKLEIYEEIWAKANKVPTP
ncbi:hypothetical protein [Ostreiculturibacter nitratireducens]|uniref:hypothetical protein n=1 Tax=Ostreiculturibacter nitratireducens TaxID=3075226 RepID=UPI0031B56615